MICKRCGRKFSRGTVCPRCGAHVSCKQSPAYKKAIKFRIVCISLFLVIIAAIAVIINAVASSGNPLMKTDFITVNVSGEKATDIEQCGYVRISDGDFRNLNSSKLLEFAESKVNGSGLSWVSVISESGKGLCFAGSNPSVVTYGTLGDNGAIVSIESVYILQGGEYISE